MRETLTTHRIQIEPEQDAADPNLCPLAEFYFLTYLSYLDLNTSKPNLVIGQVEIKGENTVTYGIQKDRITNVQFNDSGDKRPVKLGARTVLGLIGPQEDMIMIPTHEGLSTGRPIKDNYLNGVEDRVKSNPFLVNNVYMQAQLSLIWQARERHSTIGQPISYSELYQKLKRNLISNHLGI